MSVFTKRFTFRKRHLNDPDDDEDDDDDEEEEDAEDSTETHSSRSLAPEEIILPPAEKPNIPSFFHIGGWAKECLIRGYKIGTWHIDCTTAASDNYTLYSFGEAKPDPKTISGGVGIREKFGIYEMSQAWQTDGYLGTIGVNTKGVGGLLYSMLRATYAPRGTSGVKLAMHSGFERSPFKVEVIVPILKMPKLMGYVLVQPGENYELAYRMVYDVENKGFDKHALCLGYYDGRTELGIKYENFTDLRGSIFQRFGENWAFAIKANLYGDEAKNFAVGCQCKISDNALLKVKLRDDALFGIVYQFKLSENIEVMYHVGFNVRSPLQDDHKLGVSWSLKS